MSVHETADVSPEATVSDTAAVWHLAQVRERATIGQQTIVGRGCYIGTGVTVGARCKIQNYALIYEPAVLGDGVFVGPGAVFTNDQYPRAIRPDGQLKNAADWESVGVTVSEGASIGARAVCVAPVVIGRWAMVAAGAVVIEDVPDFGLVVGVPARQIGWVGPAGVRLMPHGKDGNCFVCPVTNQTFRVVAPGQLVQDVDGA